MKVAAISAMGGVLGFAAGLGAQCQPEWLPGAEPPGIDGLVFAITKWDPDGPGPRAPVLVAGGPFEIAGNAVAANVAAWDGVAWSALGDGIPTLSQGYGGGTSSRVVRALGVYGGELIAGVQTSTSTYPGYGGSPGEVLFRWDGNSWAEGWTGIEGHSTGYSAYYGVNTAEVSALAVYQGQLIIGGDFAKVGGQPAGGLARWVGSWQPMAGGVDGRIYALAVHQGHLYAGGEFAMAGGQPARNIARWNGASWQPVGTGLGQAIYGDAVRALTVHWGALVAAGRFKTAGGQMVNNVAWWNGAAWQPAGSGIPLPALDIYQVDALGVYNGELIAGGFLSDGAAGQPAHHVQRWNGHAWQGAGSGVGAETWWSHVFALGVFNGRLVAGGQFRDAGGRAAWNIAGWSGLTGQWRPLGAGTPGLLDGGHVAGLCSYNGGLAGWGTMPTGETPRVLRRASPSSEWEVVGTASGSEFPTLSEGIEYAGELVICGQFTHVNGVQAGRVARWDGAQWRPLHWGMTNEVKALAVRGSDLIAGGQFAYAGGQSAKSVARWDGTSWHAMGGGVGGVVRDLAVYNGDVIASGWILTAGGQPAKHLVRWNGASWSSVGGGVFPPPSALGVHAGELIVAGIDLAGATPVARMARWNGVQWLSMGSGPPNPQANVLVSYRGELVAAGYWGVTRWNGLSWQDLDTGVGTPNGIPAPQCSGLTVLDGELVVAGNFRSAGGRVSYNVARWACGCYPDCNHNGFLGGGDYTCFNAMYAQGHPYADCDGDGQLTPADFVCFQAKFAAGCP